jgi:uncharacterized protein (TIGR03435 family)
MSNRTAGSLILMIAAAAACAQEFEVASVRQNKLDDRIVTVNVGPGGNFNARGYTLVLLMQRAYAAMDWNVTGGPGWIRTDRWDVAAKADVSGSLTERQLQAMLQALLADRFKLRLHRDAKEMSGYALVVARGGLKVHASSDGEEHPDSFRLNGTGLTGQGVNMEDFARFVGGKLGLVVVDNTGLKGSYDFKASWKAEPEVVQPTDGTPGPDPRDGLRGAVFAALQDQLGLQIIPQKITVHTLVIDSVEKASGN